MSLKKWFRLEKKQIQLSLKLSDFINTIQVIQEEFKKLSEVRK